MRRAAAILRFGAACTLTLALLEGSLRVLVGGGLLRLPAPPPSASGAFWDASHPVFGVWHRPRADFEHQSECFSARYRTNSVGARDRERDRRSDHRRIVVLGDSFIEGWGLSEAERLTNLLERDTGLEHLNFGMAHLGPYQYSLVYRELAREFAHDAVLIGILAANDFFDLDYELARRAASYEYVYRPYLVGRYPDYHEWFYREPVFSGLLRRSSYTANALAFALRRLRGVLAPERSARVQPPPGLEASFAYDFSDAQFDLLRTSLERIQQAAQGRRVAVVLIPSHSEFARNAQQPGPSPLARRLGAFCDARGMRLVDLLPPLAARGEDPLQDYFLPCDYHWNARANRLTADVLEAVLREDFYPAQ